MVKTFKSKEKDDWPPKKKLDDIVFREPSKKLNIVTGRDYTAEQFIEGGWEFTELTDTFVQGFEWASLGVDGFKYTLKKDDEEIEAILRSGMPPEESGVPREIEGVRLKEVYTVVRYTRPYKRRR